MMGYDELKYTEKMYILLYNNFPIGIGSYLQHYDQ